MAGKKLPHPACGQTGNACDVSLAIVNPKFKISATTKCLIMRGKGQIQSRVKYLQYCHNKRQTDISKTLWMVTNSLLEHFWLNTTVQPGRLLHIQYLWFDYY